MGMLCLCCTGDLPVFAGPLTPTCCRELPSTDATTLHSATWNYVQQSLTVLTSLSGNLQQTFDRLWYQQSCRLHSHASNEYALQLAKLSPVLSLLLDMLADVQQDCSFSILQDLTFSESAAIHLQLLIVQHTHSQLARAILDHALQPVPDACCVTYAWQATLSAVQVL